MTPEERQDAATAYLARVDQLIAEHGWMVQGVFPTEDAPGVAFAYTVGLSRPTLRHPEFIIFGLAPDVAQVILNDLGERVRGGQRFRAGQYLGDLFVGYRAALVRVDDVGNATAPLSLAVRLYGHLGVRALQVVHPDTEDRFPWEAGYAGDRTGQPLLGITPAPAGDATATGGQQ